MPLTHGGEVWEYDSLPLDFSANINPLGPSKKALEALEAWKISYYPPSSPQRLREEIAGYLGVEESRVTVWNGSVELVKELCSVFLQGSGVAVIAEPTFSEYARYACLHGAGAARVLPKTGLEHSASDVSEALDERTRLVFICRPNNPTGSAMSLGEILELLELASGKALVVVDEAFVEFSDLEGLAGYVESYGNLFVLRSLAKFFALPGLRIGYGVGSREVVKALEERRAPWSINIFAHDAAIASLSDRSYIQRTRRFVRRERSFLERKLRALGVEVMSSHANFLLLKHAWRAGDVKKALLEEGMLIRDCSSFYGLDERFIRVCVRKRSENKRLIEALRKILEKEVRGRRCRYYPCHFQGQDCTFCYCPFYPCMDRALGRLIASRSGGEVWSCKDCRAVHEEGNVRRMLELLGGRRVEELDRSERLRIKELAINPSQP